MRSFSLTLVTLAALACGNNTPATPPPAPPLSSTFPLAAAANVALDAKPSAVFDIEMAPLGTTNFTLVQGTTAVAGTVTNPDGVTAVFTPTSALAPGAGYTATILAGTKSKAGGSFAADQSWSFTTTSPPGTVAP